MRCADLFTFPQLLRASFFCFVCLFVFCSYDSSRREFPPCSLFFYLGLKKFLCSPPSLLSTPCAACTPSLPPALLFFFFGSRPCFFLPCLFPCSTSSVTSRSTSDLFGISSTPLVAAPPSLAQALVLFCFVSPSLCASRLLFPTHTHTLSHPGTSLLCYFFSFFFALSLVLSAAPTVVLDSERRVCGAIPVAHPSALLPRTTYTHTHTRARVLHPASSAFSRSAALGCRTSDAPSPLLVGCFLSSFSCARGVLVSSLRLPWCS